MPIQEVPSWVLHHGIDNLQLAMKPQVYTHCGSGSCTKPIFIGGYF